MKRITLNDVAKEAGVSTATVSRVVNDHPHVSQKVRDKVLEVIDEIGYNPHIAARSLASKKTRNIGLVFPNSIHSFFTDPYFPRLTEGIALACNENDYTLSLFIFHTEELEKKLIPRIIRGGLVDGIVVQTTRIEDNLLSKIAEGDIPFVVAGKPMTLPDASYIDVDNLNGAYNAVAHLIRGGKEHIGIVTGPLNSASGRDRLAGYKKALRERSIPLDDSLITEGDYTEDAGYYGAKNLLKNNQNLDAIFAASDSMAIGVLKALRESSISVPEEVAVVGFDDLPPSRSATPSLTTVRQPIRRFGVQAVEILLDIIKNGEEPPRQVVLETELVIRQSCGMG